MGILVGPPMTGHCQDFLRAQKMFFLATAPLSPRQHVNVSAKSADLFRVVDNHTVAYADLTGSGCETVAHLLQNGSITLLFVEMGGPPQHKSTGVKRLYGTGRPLLPKQAILDENICRAFGGKDALLDLEQNRGVRSVIVVHVDRVTHSCGLSVPIFDYVGERGAIERMVSKKGYEGMRSFRAQKNSYSIDGLRSVAQLEQARVPQSAVYSSGYYHSQYGPKEDNCGLLRSSLMWARQEARRFQMTWKYVGYEGFALKQRYISPLVYDLALLLIGLCLGLALHAWLTRIGISVEMEA